MNNNQAVNLQTNKRKMHQRFRCFLVVLMLIFTGTIFAQINTDIKNYLYAKNIKTDTAKDSLLPVDIFKLTSKKAIATSQAISAFKGWNNSPHITIHNFNLLSPIAKNFSSMQLGIVCKKELQFEKKTSIPLRLRLGSLDYTNYLEQKPNSLKPF